MLMEIGAQRVIFVYSDPARQGQIPVNARRILIAQRLKTVMHVTERSIAIRLWASAR